MAVQAFLFLEREGLDQSRLVQDGRMAPILLQIAPPPLLSNLLAPPCLPTLLC